MGHLVLVIAALLCAVCVASPPSPTLVFFSELAQDQVQGFFANTTLVSQLRTLHANVSLAMREFSPERAEAVRSLNRAGVPVTAWLLLPKDQGYWLNMNNVDQAMPRFEQFLNWTHTYNLTFSRVGLDIEFDLRELNDILHGDLEKFAQMFLHDFKKENLVEAQEAFDLLTRTIRAHYPVESYILPSVLDERAVNGSTLIQRVLGTVDVRSVDYEVPMLYTSAFPHGPGQLASYGPNAQFVGLGSTGSSGSIGAKNLMTWATFSRDLVFSAKHTPAIYVYSLEGSQAKGFLEPLVRGFDYSRDLTLDEHLQFDRELPWVTKMRSDRRTLCRASLDPDAALEWAATHPKQLLVQLIEFVLFYLTRNL